MKLYSLENTKRSEKQNNLYDLSYPMLSDKDVLFRNINSYKVNIDREMRIDLICSDIYGTTRYIDELMYINGIIDPYSIKEGDIIFWVSVNDLGTIRNSYKEDDEKEKLDLVKNKNNIKEELTISSPSENFVPVLLDRENGKIIITNKLK
jgi:hypothetical protein